jgi:uncharacterized phage protein (TIGR01671 family)
MRTLKFRAWDKIAEQMTPCTNKFINFSGVVWENYRYGLEGVDEFHSTERLILMQFTGLLDRHGNEVFEGDVIKNNRYSGYSQVVWKQEEGCEAGIVKGMFGEERDLTGFISEIGSFVFEGIGQSTKAHYVGEFEVIGNIYEHSHLLTDASTGREHHTEQSTSQTKNGLKQRN